jgi:hypothetical protein
MSNKETSSMISDKVKQIQNIFTDLAIPSVYELPKSKERIQTKKPDIVLSINIDYPKFSFGFQHFVHAKKERLDIMSRFEKKKKVYLVVNQYNEQIDDYETDIESMAKVYFDTDPRPNIVNNKFYGLWEVLNMLDVVSTNGSFSSIHMMDDGAMAQAVLLYRSKYAKKDAKKDSYSIYEKNNNDNNFSGFNTDLLKYYKKESPQRLHINLKPKKANLVTISLGDKWKYKNMKEQDSTKLFIKQLYSALELVQNNGSIICRMFETFTISINKLIYALNEIFTHVYIVKPLATDAMIDDKYVICKGYNENKNKLSNTLKSIIEKFSNKSNRYLVNVYTEFVIPNDYLSVLRKLNTDISNRQLINVNKTLTYIESENYYGDTYQDYRSDQIKASNKWIEKFFPSNTELNKIRKEVDEIIKTNNIRADIVDKKLTR